MNTQKKKSQLPSVIAVLVIVGLVVGLVIVYSTGNKSSSKKKNTTAVAKEVKKAFQKIDDHIKQLENYYKNDPKKILTQAKKDNVRRKMGNFYYSMGNLGLCGKGENADICYCIIAEHADTKGRIYYSTTTVDDPTWDDKVSYYHFENAKQPNPDKSGGPCKANLMR